MRLLAKVGIILLVIGLSFFASTFYRSGSTNSFTFGVFGFLPLRPYSWSAENQTNQISTFLWAPRDLRMDVKTNTTVDLYVLDTEGIRLWAKEGKLNPAWVLKEVNQQIFTLEITRRGEYGFLVYNPTNSSAAFEIDSTLYSYEKDLLSVSLAFVIAGVIVTMVSLLTSRKCTLDRRKRQKFTLPKSIKTATLLLAIIFLFYMVSGSECFTVSNPTWLKKGAFAEYHLESGYVETPQKRVIVVNNTNIVLNYTSKRFDEGTYRWECTELNETTAKLKITLTIKQDATSRWIADVYVDILSRAVYLENGTLFGTTHLWLPANPTPNDDLILWDMPPDKVTLRIENREERGETIQGKQKSFTIIGTGKIGGSNAIFTIMCDFDTGILIDGGLEHEPTVKALNIADISGDFSFSNTNIDLGPPDNPLDLRTIFTIIALPTAFIIIFVALYRQQRRKR
jgi:hypothetical protein